MLVLVGDTPVREYCISGRTIICAAWAVMRCAAATISVVTARRSAFSAAFFSHPATSRIPASVMQKSTLIDCLRADLRARSQVGGRLRDLITIRRHQSTSTQAKCGLAGVARSVIG